MALKKKVARKKTSKKKVATKKVSTKKAAKKVVKKAVQKKAVKKKAVQAAPRLKAITSKQTKIQIIQTIAEDTGIARKDVADVFESLARVLQRHMQRRGSGEFTIPETGVKIRKVRKPASKSRMGRNPATGEAVKIAAKPASTVIKLRALKTLKDTLG
ncbi:MAG: HU family DNA-binding protein [gamma proteobacterium symbiont of Bathyaustriella thionipta]|nr:HU family DNA-binding protein [gamma proteobacterium symbiont of Bathyaustriella thionipta]